MPGQRAQQPVEVAQKVLHLHLVGWPAIVDAPLKQCPERLGIEVAFSAKMSSVVFPAPRKPARTVTRVRDMPVGPPMTAVLLRFDELHVGSDDWVELPQAHAFRRVSTALGGGIGVARTCARNEADIESGAFRGHEEF